MRVVERSFYGRARGDTFRVVPIGDIHLGAAACDERLFAKVVKGIADDPSALWIGMGDYCDFINRSDKRFDVMSVAEWARAKPDIVRAQFDRLMEHLRPIAGKCLALVEGNHETAIYRKYERDIYSDIVTEVKKAAKMKPECSLAVGYYGWLRLHFYSTRKTEAAAGWSGLTFNLHHGFGGGKLAGGKALNMEKWLWTHDADVVLFGHTHNQDNYKAAVEGLDKFGNLVTSRRVGAYTGTFLSTVNEGGQSSYSEVKGYFPLPIGGLEILLRPRAEDPADRIKVVS